MSFWFLIAKLLLFASEIFHYIVSIVIVENLLTNFSEMLLLTLNSEMKVVITLIL